MQAYKRTPALENSTWYKGILASQLATSSETNDAFDFVESKMRKGTEPPPHVHDREDELFYILAGEIKAFVDGKVLTVSAGECVFLPRKVPHATGMSSQCDGTILSPTSARTPMEGAAIDVLRPRIDERGAVTVVFTDGTFATYSSEELAKLRPQRENFGSNPSCVLSIRLKACSLRLRLYVVKNVDQLCDRPAVIK